MRNKKIKIMGGNHLTVITHNSSKRRHCFLRFSFTTCRCRFTIDKYFFPPYFNFFSLFLFLTYFYFCLSFLISLFTSLKPSRLEGVDLEIVSFSKVAVDINIASFVLVELHWTETFLFFITFEAFPFKKRNIFMSEPITMNFTV